MKILIVCFNADLNIPCSQSQWSCSHICPTASSGSTFLVFPIAFITKSIINPAIIPIINFVPNIFRIMIGETDSEINIGSISSDVDKYTDISVPSVITLAAYKFVADTENPHCGNMPNMLPNNGPYLSDFFII